MEHNNSKATPISTTEYWKTDLSNTARLWLAVCKPYLFFSVFATLCKFQPVFVFLFYSGKPSFEYIVSVWTTGDHSTQFHLDQSFSPVPEPNMKSVPTFAAVVFLAVFASTGEYEKRFQVHNIKVLNYGRTHHRTFPLKINAFKHWLSASHIIIEKH